MGRTHSRQVWNGNEITKNQRQFLEIISKVMSSTAKPYIAIEVLCSHLCNCAPRPKNDVKLNYIPSNYSYILFGILDISGTSQLLICNKNDIKS